MAETTPPAGGPLDGCLVVDLSHALAGPHAAMMLGDLGARVIKIEAPGLGDETRGWGPPFAAARREPRDPGEPCGKGDPYGLCGQGESCRSCRSCRQGDPLGQGEPRTREAPEPPGAPEAPEPPEAPQSTYFLSCNRNKESVTADLTTEEGRDLLTRLVRRADVLVENFRPGALDRLGFPLKRLREANPALVVLSISGFGHDGPQGGRAGYDQIAQGEAGLMSLTGDPGSPTKVGTPIADLLAGIFGVVGVLAALVERRANGRGRVVRTSLLSSVVGIHSFQGTRWTVAGEVPSGSGNRHPSIAPYGLFHCADGDLQLAAGSERLWRSVAAVTGLDPDDPRFATNADRVRHGAALTAALEAVFGRDSADAWIGRLDAAGVPAGRVRTLDEVYAWDQTRQQGLILGVDHPTLGPIELPGPPWQFDDGARTRHTAPPTLGQHNTSVRAWLDAAEAAEGDDADAGGDADPAHGDTADADADPAHGDPPGDNATAPAVRDPARARP